jgi:hypothetical protein
LGICFAALVVLIVHGVVFYNQFLNPWSSQQKAYFEQAQTRARNASEKEELGSRSPKVEQLLVSQFGESRVDRCMTCHIASDDPRFKDHFQPLKSHPYSVAMGDVQKKNGEWERKHKFTDFGCTVCHDGQGRGLDQFHAHGEDEFWPDPLLGYVTQANWRKDFRPARSAIPKRTSPARRTSVVDGSFSSSTTVSAATRSKACRKGRWVRSSPRLGRSSKSTICGSRLSSPAPISRPLSCRSSRCRWKMSATW